MGNYAPKPGKANTVESDAKVGDEAGGRELPPRTTDIAVPFGPHYVNLVTPYVLTNPVRMQGEPDYNATENVDALISVLRDCTSLLPDLLPLIAGFCAHDARRTLLLHASSSFEGPPSTVQAYWRAHLENRFTVMRLEFLHQVQLFRTIILKYVQNTIVASQVPPHELVDYFWSTTKTSPEGLAFINDIRFHADNMRKNFLGEARRSSGWVRQGLGGARYLDLEPNTMSALRSSLKVGFYPHISALSTTPPSSPSLAFSSSSSSSSLSPTPPLSSLSACSSSCSHSPSFSSSSSSSSAAPPHPYYSSPYFLAASVPKHFTIPQSAPSFDVPSPATDIVVTCGFFSIAYEPLAPLGFVIGTAFDAAVKETLLTWMLDPTYLHNFERFLASSIDV